MQDKERQYAICRYLNHSKPGRKHIPTRLFKQAVNLSKQAQKIEQMLDEITPFNTGKKKEEVLVLLKKWFPQMENFKGQLKKYQVTIEALQEENAKLEERAKAGEQGKVKNTLERVKLESEVRDLQKIIDPIPPEMLRELWYEKEHEHKEQL